VVCNVPSGQRHNCKSEPGLPTTVSPRSSCQVRVRPGGAGVLIQASPACATFGAISARASSCMIVCMAVSRVLTLSVPLLIVSEHAWQGRTHVPADYAVLRGAADTPRDRQVDQSPNWTLKAFPAPGNGIRRHAAGLNSRSFGPKFGAFGEEYIGGCKRKPTSFAANITTLKIDQDERGKESKVEPQSCTRVRIRLAFLRRVALNETTID
jgi:hypothetical protein